MYEEAGAHLLAQLDVTFGSAQIEGIKMARLMTIAEVQRELAVSRATVYRLRDRGTLRLVNIGRAARVPSEDVESYLSSLVT